MMDVMVWTVSYLKTILFGLVCVLILSVPWLSSMEPGEGIPGWYFVYGILLSIAGYVLGLLWFT